MKTLYKCEIPLTKRSQRIRLFLWHKNTTASRVYVNVLASLSSGTGTISDLRIEEPTTGSDVDRGVCLAKTHLLSSWGPALPSPILSASETSIWECFRDQNGLAAMVMEFNVSTSSPGALRIRTTVASQSGVVGAFTDGVLASDGSHIRGWWPYSALQLDCGSFDAKPPAPNTQHIHTISVCESGGKETGTGGFESLRSGDTANVGCYGANLTYCVSLTNSGNQAYPVRAYENLRGTGQPAGGATGIHVPTGFPTLGVNFLKAANDDDFCRLTIGSNGLESPILVASGEQGLPLQINVAVAGATATPFNLILAGLAIEPNHGGG